MLFSSLLKKIQIGTFVLCCTIATSSTVHGFEPAIDVKVIKTEAIKLAQFKIDPRSFDKKTGLKGEISLPETTYAEKEVHFTLKNEVGNLVWESQLGWQNTSQNYQKFTFKKEDFLGLSGIFDLEAKILSPKRQIIATTQTSLEINNEPLQISTSILDSSRLEQAPTSVELNLSFENQQNIGESILRINIYQDFLAPENLLRQEFFPLGKMIKGAHQENIRLEDFHIAGNFLITAQVFDGLKNAKSGVKQWDLFFPGDFIAFKYLKYELDLARNIQLNISAGGPTNALNSKISIKDDLLFITDDPLVIKNNQWQVEKSFPLFENKPFYKLELNFYQDNIVLNQKTLEIENPYYKKKMRQDKVLKLIRTILNSDDFYINPKIPWLDFIQFGFIAIFLLLAYVLFKKNKRF